MAIDSKQRALLLALSNKQWRRLDTRPGLFDELQADELVRQGLAERRASQRLGGKYVYKRTVLGLRSLSNELWNTKAET